MGRKGKKKWLDKHIAYRQDKRKNEAIAKQIDEADTYEEQKFDPRDYIGETIPLEQDHTDLYKVKSEDNIAEFLGDASIGSEPTPDKTSRVKKRSPMIKALKEGRFKDVPQEYWSKMPKRSDRYFPGASEYRAATYPEPPKPENPRTTEREQARAAKDQERAESKVAKDQEREKKAAMKPPPVPPPKQDDNTLTDAAGGAATAASMLGPIGIGAAAGLGAASYLTKQMASQHGSIHSFMPNESGGRGESSSSSVMNSSMVMLSALNRIAGLRSRA